MNLSLNEAEREHLGALGVTVGADGSMRSASGRQITPGTAVQLLAKAAISPDGEDLAKGLVPSRFMRPYLSASHAADSPANTGMRGTTAVPETSRDIEPQDYDRGWIYPEHQEPSPGDQAGNNPNAPDAPASAVYGSGASVYARNQRAIATERYAPSQYNMSEPAACRQVALPSDMRASAVPQAAQALATRPAPGER